MGDRPLRFALAGDPVEHSRSPVMHQEAFRLTGLTGDYELIRSDRAGFGAVVERLRNGLLDGLNVTMPLKAEACRLADVATPQAGVWMSANTMRCRAGVVEAHSTDIVAFEHLFGSVGGPIHILGSGASARAALAAVDGSPVYLSARNPDAVSELAATVGGEVIPWGEGVAGSVLVNTTPLGMAGESVPGRAVDVCVAIIDLPYGAKETPLVSHARREGKPVVDGLDFLGIQAAASFEWWTGIGVNSEDLVTVARNA